jgi:hypothetical protein
MKRIVLSALTLLSLAVASVAVVPQVSPVYAADAKSAVCGGISQAEGKTGNCPDQSGKINDAIAAVVNIFSMIVGIVAVIVVVVAGFRYVTSGGDSSKINTARTELTYAIVGLVVVGMAQAIVKFVLQKTT